MTKKKNMQWHLAAILSDAPLRDFSAVDQDDADPRAGTVGVFDKTVAAGIPTLSHTGEQFQTRGLLAIDEQPPVLHPCRPVPCVQRAFSVTMLAAPIPWGINTICRRLEPITSTSDISNSSGQFWRSIISVEPTTDPPIGHAYMVAQSHHRPCGRNPLWTPHAGYIME